LPTGQSSILFMFRAWDQWERRGYLQGQQKSAIVTQKQINCDHMLDKSKGICYTEAKIRNSHPEYPPGQNMEIERGIVWPKGHKI